MKKIIYGASIRGNDHYISGQECQDANSYCANENFGDDVAVMAISDGHGGAPYCRSAYGSATAVDVAKQEMKEFISEHKLLLDELDLIDKKIQEEFGDSDVSMVMKSHFQLQKDIVTTSLEEDFSLLKNRIWVEWKKRIDAHLTENPITLINASMNTLNATLPMETKKFMGYGIVDEESVTFINTDVKEVGAMGVKKNPRHLYGATLICVGNYKTHYFILQIGDGDIVAIDENDSVLSLFEDDGLVANETHSLCQSNAIKHFKERYLCFDAKIVMLSTDGIVNAVEDESFLVSLAKGIYDNVVDEPEGIKKDFKQLLRGFSNGSGDDCTICFLANHIPVEKYNCFNDSIDVEEANDLQKLYRKKFDSYKFEFPEVEAVPKINGIYKFNELSKTIFSSVLRLDDYEALIKSKWVAGENPKSFMFNKLLEVEKELNEEQTRIYKEALNSYLGNHPVIIVSFELTNIGLKDGGLDVYEKDKVYGLVREMDDKKVSFEILNEQQYNVMRSAGYQLFYLDAKKRICDNYVIDINKDKISLIKTKE